MKAIRIDPEMFRSFTDQQLQGARDVPEQHSTPQEITTELASFFASKQTAVHSALYDLISQLHYDLRVVRKGTEGHLAVAHALFDNMGGETTGTAEQGDQWEGAIVAVVRRLGRLGVQRRRLQLHPSQQRTIDAVVRLRAAGFAFGMESGIVSAEPAVWMAALNAIDRAVPMQGGMALATAHIRTVQGQWSNELGRFLLGQRYG